MVQSGTDDSFDTRLGAVVERFLEAQRAGERPSIEEYAARHPELADRLRRVLSQVAFLEAAKREAVESPSGTAPRWESEPIPPPILGSYRLVAELGRGGMGVVYEAEQVPLGRRVALKVFSASSALDPARIERFRREAHAAAVLDHPNIVPVYEIGEEGGRHFYSMKRVAGEGLDRVIADLRDLVGGQRRELGAPAGPSRPDSITPSSGAWRLLTESLGAPSAGPEASRSPSTRDATTDSARRRSADAAMEAGQARGAPRVSLSYFLNVARVGLQVAEALSCAHSGGILHRDIKPSNLLLDGSGKVWVTDFGLARVDGLEDVTRSGEVAGTFRYMAPERFRGRSLPQSDVYGLGLTLYELLTFRWAFEEPAGNGLLRRILEDEPRPPALVDPRVPDALDAIVRKAIAKEPGDRHESADALARDLRRFLGGAPRRSRWAALAARPARLCRRRPGATALLAACCLLVLLVLGVAWSPFLGQGPADARGTAGAVAPSETPSLKPSAPAAPGPLGVEASGSEGGERAPRATRLRDLFDPPVLVPLGDEARGPMDLVVADLDGDGAPDIVTANAHSRNLSVFRNEPAEGAFEDAGVIPEGDIPMAIVAADLDGDGRPDLAVGSRGSKDVTVLRNRGGLRFESSAVHAMGFEPFGIAALDVDEDADMDVVTVGRPGSLRILRNAGGGELSPEETVAVPGDPSGLAVADVTGDRRADLVVVDTGKSEVRILDGVARGFRPRSETLAVGFGACGCTAEDLDGDGWVDIAVPNYIAGTVSILRNSGRGRFAQAETHATGQGAFWVAAGDLDGDGRPDLAVPGERDGSLWLLRNEGTTFSRAEKVDLQGPGNRARIADLDGDGDLDIVATAGRVAFLRSRSIGPGPALPAGGEQEAGGGR